MATIVDDEECILGLVLFDHVTDLEHEFSMGIFGRYGEYFSLKVVVLLKAFLQFPQL